MGNQQPICHEWPPGSHLLRSRIGTIHTTTTPTSTNNQSSKLYKQRLSCTPVDDDTNPDQRLALYLRTGCPKYALGCEVLLRLDVVPCIVLRLSPERSPSAGAEEEATASLAVELLEIVPFADHPGVDLCQLLLHLADCHRQEDDASMHSSSSDDDDDDTTTPRCRRQCQQNAPRPPLPPLSVSEVMALGAKVVAERLLPRDATADLLRRVGPLVGPAATAQGPRRPWYSAPLGDACLLVNPVDRRAYCVRGSGGPEGAAAPMLLPTWEAVVQALAAQAASELATAVRSLAGPADDEVRRRNRSALRVVRAALGLLESVGYDVEE